MGPGLSRVSWASALLFPIALSLAVSACKKPSEVGSAQKPETPIKVQTAAVVEKPMPEHLVLTGSLKASQESEVAADATGKVKATYVERGQKVKPGDTLVLLDSRGASINVTAAVAQSNLAKTQLDQAQKECGRVKTLFESGAISQAEYDRATSQCEATKWSLAAANAQEQNAQKVAGDTVIRAPFAGYVGERYVNVGQFVQANTRVVSLYAPDPLRVELTVPESSIAGIKVDLPISFTVSSYGEEKFAGNVKFISPHVRPSTRDMIVEAFCPNPDGKLKPGMFAVAALESGEKPFPTVPSAALKKEAGETRAFVLLDKRIQERVVQTGSEREGLTAIPVGLAVGEKVVLTPGADVHDGALVE